MLKKVFKPKFKKKNPKKKKKKKKERKRIQMSVMIYTSSAKVKVMKNCQLNNILK